MLALHVRGLLMSLEKWEFKELYMHLYCIFILKSVAMQIILKNSFKSCFAHICTASINVFPVQ